MGQPVTKKQINTSEKSGKMTNFDAPKEIKDSRDTIRERDTACWEEDFELESRKAEHGIRD